MDHTLWSLESHTTRQVRHPPALQLALGDGQQLFLKDVSSSAGIMASISEVGVVCACAVDVTGETNPISTLARGSLDAMQGSIPIHRAMACNFKCSKGVPP
mmetsp:Transcript_74294/g.117607  ORF Transcript_74294/g.117607 Transcript_74294/m.117607 type:complete len:101 (-) Transcript_74294:174-476(-)